MLSPTAATAGISRTASALQPTSYSGVAPAFFIGIHGSFTASLCLGNSRSFPHGRFLQRRVSGQSRCSVLYFGLLECFSLFSLCSTESIHRNASSLLIDHLSPGGSHGKPGGSPPCLHPPPPSREVEVAAEAEAGVAGPPSSAMAASLTSLTRASLIHHRVQNRPHPGPLVCSHLVVTKAEARGASQPTSEIKVPQPQPQLKTASRVTAITPEYASTQRTTPSMGPRCCTSAPFALSMATAATIIRSQFAIRGAASHEFFTTRAKTLIA